MNKTTEDFYKYLKSALKADLLEDFDFTAKDVGDGVIEFTIKAKDAVEFIEFSAIHREDTDEYIIIKKPVATPC